MRKYLVFILFIFIVSGIDTQLFAQHRGDIIIAQQGQRDIGQRDQRRGNNPRQRDRQKDRPNIKQRRALEDLKRFERLRMLKLLDLLNLDENTEARVIPHIRKFHKQMFGFIKEHEVMINQLANGLKKHKFSDDEIIERIIEIDQLERKRQDRIGEFHRQAKEVLTAEQLGKLYVFQARFGAEVREKMRDFKKAQDKRP